MKVINNAQIPDVKLITINPHHDNRGYFAETWNLKNHLEYGLPTNYAQDNISKSSKNTLRGIHFQVEPFAQGKLVGVAYGMVYDVAVDLRPDSSTFKQWVGYDLDPYRQLYIPPGFGHGFVVVSEEAIFTYKCTAPYSPEHQHSIIWNDPEIGIKWPTDKPVLAPKDKDAYDLKQWIIRYNLEQLRVET